MLHRKLTAVATLAAIVALVVVPALVLTACSGASNSETQQSASGQVAQLGVQIVGTMPHDPQSFTEGLEIVAPGVMAESSGLSGKSFVQLVEVGSGKVLKKAAYPDGEFGEGLTKVDDKLVTLTWKDGRFYRWDATTLTPSAPQRLQTKEGWGACYDEATDTVWTSDGTSTLTGRDPKTMKAHKTVKVTKNGVPLEKLNELECVSGMVWANVWQTSQLVVIDPQTGNVRAIADLNFVSARARIDADGRAFTDDDVLNGTAWDAKTSTMWVTGKRWDKIYQLKIDKVM
ncbi:glutaminyl-peptide cyclotransferase [Arcanobacterium bovis]|uniref:Glutaminyl-peptide cyclotransferase n=1 Tax=Arcanobacterium bovis TaxID=2529275 RepID=A0A4Q9V2M5_9ACTO|nr:glutaminyl-peptide cyclotransferase [Arcanobacterium bovis]TBW23858.1 glutaminyl-peptide cyclotransferase [Arcanobacterium bovis]